MMLHPKSKRQNSITQPFTNCLPEKDRAPPLLRGAQRPQGAPVPPDASQAGRVQGRQRPRDAAQGGARGAQGDRHLDGGEVSGDGGDQGQGEGFFFTDVLELCCLY